MVTLHPLVVAHGEVDIVCQFLAGTLHIVKDIQLTTVAGCVASIVVEGGVGGKVLRVVDKGAHRQLVLAHLERKSGHIEFVDTLHHHVEQTHTGVRRQLALDPQRQAGGHILKRLLCQGDIAPPLGRRGKPIYLGEQLAQSLDVLFHISLLL